MARLAGASMILKEGPTNLWRLRKISLWSGARRELCADEACIACSRADAPHDTRCIARTVVRKSKAITLNESLANAGRATWSNETRENMLASHDDMMLIMWSLALLFDHGRRPISTNPPPAIVCPVSPLRIAIERPPGMEPALVDTALTETATVWRPLGCVIEWEPADPLAHAAVRVIFTDDEPVNSTPDDVLAWIRFLESGRPESVIHVSRVRARRLLASRRGALDAPVKWHDVLLSRIIGRALAHELGHYVLASKAHTATGLMRPRFTLEELVANDRAGFRLPQKCPTGDLAAPHGGTRTW